MSQTGICSLPQGAGERDHVRAFERDCPDFQVLRDELVPGREHVRACRDVERHLPHWP